MENALQQHLQIVQIKYIFHIMWMNIFEKNNLIKKDKVIWILDIC